MGSIRLQTIRLSRCRRKRRRKSSRETKGSNYSWTLLQL
jgi:hypothetical protein